MPIYDRNTQLIEFAYYTTPDNVQYPLFGGSRVILSWQDMGMPEINYLQDRGPFQHGVTVRDFRLNPRVITLTQFERGWKRDDFYCNEAALVAAIRPNRSSTQQAGTLLFIRPDTVEVEIPARILDGPSGDWDGTGGVRPPDYREQLRFFCADPVFRLPATTTLTYELDETAACLDTCLPFGLAQASFSESQNVTYTGTWEGDQITIVITGPVRNPEIVNDTTGLTIKLNYTVAEGETVTISILPNIVTVENGNGINLIGTVDDLSSLATFVLATIGDLTATGVNSLSVYGEGGLIGTSQVTITYYTRHISAFVPC